MGKEGKVHLWSVVISSILIFLVYVVLVLAATSGPAIFSTFPEDNTNASASFGYSPSKKNASFNGTDPQFQCNVIQNSTSNVTNVSLYLSNASLPTATAQKNQTLNGSGHVNVTFIFNTTTLNEGTYFWFCETEDNSTNIQYNTTLNRTIIIDKSVPGFTSFSNTSINVTKVSTEDVVYISANFTDKYTTIDTVRLFVNLSGVANNVVNTTSDTSSNGVAAGNGTRVNLSFRIPGIAANAVLNFTLAVNDSVNNVNITSAIILQVTGDATPPGPISLSNPIKSFNTSSPNVEFNFTAVDNNDTSLICNISVVNSPYNGEKILNITNIATTSGTPQLNSTTNVSLTLSSGTYSWNVSCLDSPGNENVSLSRTFIVDNIAPFGRINITNTSQLSTSSVSVINESGSGNSIKQGDTIFLTTNLTDNLTQPLRVSFQYLNVSSGTWTEADTQPVVAVTATGGTNQDYWGNASFAIPTGRNVFEGENVSFRVVYNDTLGNSATNSTDLIVQINDTYAPTITINGSVETNGTAIADTTPLISWFVNENNKLTLINISVDGTRQPVAGEESCGKAALYDRGGGSFNVEKFRNFSFSISSDSECVLSNGLHSLNITAIDVWGNSRKIVHTFTVQAGTVPGFEFNLTSDNGVGTWSKSAINNSNITSLVGITLFGTNGVGAEIDRIVYKSSCASAAVTVTNLTIIYPFNTSDCSDSSANQTLDITINDTAGNSNITVLGFLVDNVGPTISVHSPKNGQTFTNTETVLNISALDDDQAISSFGFFLDGNAIPTIFNVTAAQFIGGSLGGSGVNLTRLNTTNLTGTHTIKFTVNDTLGNVVNGSVITVTQTGPIKPNVLNKSLNSYLTDLNPSSTFNTSIKIKGSDGVFQEIGSANESDINGTFEIFLNINGSINVSITEINGSAANWDKINFSVLINETKFRAGVQNNFTIELFKFVLFNGSVDEFLTNENSYYGTVLLPNNISGITATAQEIWWFPNSNDLANRTNVSKCTTTFGPTTKAPCWNYSANGKTLVSVPHFSGVGGGNDTTAPTITVNSPASTVGISGVVPNITLSYDVTSCEYELNITDSAKVNGQSANVSSSVTPSKVGSNNICTFSEVRFKNGVYNITWNVTDASGNINISSSGSITTFTMSDNTAPNSGTSITSSGATTGATITISGVNESVNATVAYQSTGNTSFTGSTAIATQTDFSGTQTVTISGLSTVTTAKTFYYNITVCDFNGNCNRNNTIFTFTQGATAEDTTTTTTTTTGGGGGAAVSKVADSKAQVWSTIPAGSSVSLDVDKATIAITSVAVNNVQSELKNVDLEVQALKSNPVSVTAAGKVNQYLRINKKNIKDGDAETIKIGFRVTKSWLTDNGMTSADIRLYRYKSSVWNKLITRVTGTDSIYVNFEADAPGFSYFAVGSKSGGGDAFAIIDAIREFYSGTSSLSAFEIIDMIRGFYG